MLLILSVTSFFGALCILLAQYNRPRDHKTFLAIVLGDTGHSPRILSHCIAARKYGYTGYLVGYNLSPIHSDYSNQIKIINITPYPKYLQTNLPKYFNFILKAIFNSLSLIFTLLFKCYNLKYSKIILQNPPSIPTLAICSIFKYILNYIFIIDWHNYGYTILEANFSSTKKSKLSNFIIKISKIYEFIFARWADHHFTVTKSMQLDLSRKAFISENKITVLYDKPSKQFREQNFNDKNNDIIKLLLPDFINLPIIISSTSWTKDENFSLFFDAIEEYENIAIQQNLPKIGCIITGKGPEKNYYTKKIKNKIWNHIKWSLPWLEADDYPKILNAATLGVCLHSSSSGLDLPMKVVDMLGSGLPVLALNYQSIEELVKPGINGELFNNSEELLYLLGKYLSKLHESTPKDTFQKGLITYRDIENSWENEWHQKVVRNAQIF